MEIDKSNVKSLVEETWESVREKVEEGAPVSSEKTLVYLFAIELYKRVGDGLQVDFKNQCYGELEGSSRYLDLLVYTSEQYKVAFEFKLPRKSSGGASNQPETREAIYRDIGRLRYLRKNSIKAKACFFLMAANEAAYLNKGNYTRSPDLITAERHHLRRDNTIEVDDLSLSGVSCNFRWQGIGKYGAKYSCVGKYAWLEPIKL